VAADLDDRHRRLAAMINADALPPMREHSGSAPAT
jgi:hypothetical protein